jgi:hypothetical protein
MLQRFAAKRFFGQSRLGVITILRKFFSKFEDYGETGIRRQTL